LRQTDERWSGTLRGDGVLYDDLVVVNEPPQFEDCLFQVCIRTRVSAAEELKEEEEKARLSKRLDPVSLELQNDLLTTLRRVNRKEQEMNRKLMADQMGSDITYGQVIQLKHKKSGKFLSVSKDDTAISETENFRVLLCSQASTLSWFTLQPAKAFQSDNEPVMNFNDAFLCVTDRDDEYLHISKHAFRQPDLLERESLQTKFPNLQSKEVNSSLDKTPWKMCRFSESNGLENEVKGTSHVPLQVGDVIYFRDPETRSYFQLNVNGECSAEDETAFNKFSKWAEGDVEEIFHSSAYFVLERACDTDGGFVCWNDAILLRHVNSGKFLTSGTEGILYSDANREKAAKFHFEYIEAVDGDKSPVETGHALRFSCGETHLATGKGDVRMVSEQDDAVPLLICKEDAATYRDVSFGLKIAPLLDVLYKEERVVRHKDQRFQLAVESAGKLKSAKALLLKLASFVCGTDDVTAWNVVTLPSRQKLLREQGILDRIVNIIEDSEVTKTGVKGANQNEIELCNACFTTLRVNLINSPQNQCFVGPRFKVLLANVESGEVAMSCITEMLDNRVIQTSYVHTEEIDLFIQLLHTDMSKGRLNATVLNVLAALCSCQGVAVETNQTRLSEMILDDNPDLLATFEATKTSIALKFPGNSEPVVISVGQPGSLTADQRDFLVSQLYLMAEMCGDRNYVAINKMMTLISFASVVSCIENEALSDEVRSAFVKMAMCAFVDVEPQQNDRYKNLTICKSHLLTNADSLPAPVNEIEILQGVIGSHLNKDDWSSFTEHLVSTLFKLITFKFYNGCLPELDSVMDTLINRLDADTREFQMIVPMESAKPTKGGPSARIFPADDEDDAEIVEAPEPEPAKTLIDILFDEGKRKRMMRVLDHYTMMIFVIFLVFAAVGAGFAAPEEYDIVVDSLGNEISRTKNETFIYFYIFDWIAFTIFTAELVVRMWAVFSFYDFFSNPFSAMDFIVVMLDIVVFIPAVKNAMSGMGSGTKALRIVRLARLARLLKVMKLMKKLHDELMKEKDVPVWKLPIKFTQSPKEKLLSMTQMVRVLNRTNDLSLRFRLRAVLQEMVTRRDPASDPSILTQLKEDSLPLKFSLQSKELVRTMLHLVMYDYSPLVQNSVDLLMSMHTMQSELTEDLGNVQLLEFKQDESVYNALEEGIDQITHEMDMFEVWSDVEDEKHIETGETVRNQLRILTQQCQQESNLWAIGGDKYDPKLDVQTMLRNLEADVAFSKWREAMDYPEPDSETEPETHAVAKLVRSLCLMINSFMVAFVRANLENQSKTFYLLPALTRDVKLGVPGASELLFQILFDNEELMKLVPCDFVETLCNILHQRKDAAVMRILTSMTQIKSVPIRENQIAIMLHLCSDENDENDVFYVCEKPGSAQYNERAELMKAIVSRVDVAVVDGPTTLVTTENAHLTTIATADTEYAHLDPKLQYHVALLDLLASCAGGGINIVEAKIQKMYSTVHLLQAIVAPETILEIKLSLARVMFEAVIDVDVPVAGLATESLLWDWLLTFSSALDEGVNLLKKWRSRKLEHPVQCRLMMCYIFDCVLPSITYFFRNYYNPNVLPTDRGPDVDVKNFANDLLDKTTTLHQVCMQLELPQASVALETKDQLLLHTRKAAFSPKRKKVADNTIIVAHVPHRRYSVTTMLTEASEEKMKRDESFRISVDKLVAHEEVIDFTQQEQKALLCYLKDLPCLTDAVDEAKENKIGILRYEPLLCKLVAHTRSQLEVRGDRKNLAQSCVHSTIWTMKLFREMIEHEWGFTYEERDEEGDDFSDEKVKKVQDALTEAQAPEMCLDFIAKGLSHEVVNEATKLLMSLLYREGGNLKVQQSIHHHLEESNSEFFFAQASDIMRLISQWQTSASGEMAESNEAEDDEDVPEPPQTQFLTALQLMCEGHYKANQNIFREQPHNDHSINLLTEMVSHFSTISKLETRSSIRTAAAIADLILEVIQGPCVGNQEYFAQETELLETMNHMMRYKVESGDEDEEEEAEDLKTTMLKVFKALLEGQGNGTASMIYERVLSVVHIEVLQLLLSPPPIDPDNEEVSPEEQIIMQEEAKNMPLRAMQVESLVLIQMLTGYNSNLTSELRLSDSVLDKMGTEVISVEIVWNGALQKRFFHVPEMCVHLAKATRTNLVQTVCRDNSDLKLTDFVEKCKVVEAELEHQDFLQKKGVSKVFSRTVQNNATWITFFINLVINLIYLLNYEWDFDPAAEKCVVTKQTAQKLSPTEDLPNYRECGASPKIKNSTLETFKTCLNITQISLSCFTLILFLVVRAPVTYRVTFKETRSRWSSFCAIFTKTSTTYYMFYVVFAVLGFDQPLFNTFLLYDILMKNATSRDVLMSVIMPIKQLMATLILGLFTIYIFAFTIYLEASNHVPYDRCSDLLRCFQLTVGMGLRNGGGMGDHLDPAVKAQLSYRFILDFLFFVAVIIVLLNVIFGIIIDTFSELRGVKKEIEEDIREKCFICSIDKSVFDKEGGRVFEEHIESEHNMWSYLKFMVFLWEQDQDDDDGLEQYVRRCIEENNLEWFPVQTALRLEHLEDESANVLDLVQRMQEMFSSEMSKVHSDSAAKFSALAAEVAQLQSALNMGESDA
jgi:hypothetical protein